MVIQPNSTIILYTGMPLDNTYTDTLYFASKTAQTNFFTVNNSYFKRSFSVNTYQRVNLGVFEANCKADDIYDCNYMAFQNTNFGDKWFYAFINSVEYVNNQTTRVNFEIDVMQTYLFDAILEDCLVEREHSATDTLFSNFVPEALPLDEYVIDYYEPLQAPNNVNLWQKDIVVMYVDTGTQTASGRLYSGSYSGCSLRAFTTTNAGINAINQFISNYIQKPDSIINMFMCPHFISNGTDSGWDITSAQVNPEFDILLSHDSTYFTSIEGYVVKNRKIFTYPYTYWHFDNSNGQSLALRYEYFRGTPQVKVFGSGTSPVQLTLHPSHYKGGGTGLNDELMTESLTLSEYPLCSWNYDTYKAWVAQNTVPIILNSVGKIASGGDVGGTVLGAVSEFYSASIKPDTIKGNISNGNALFAHDKLRFRQGRARQPIQRVMIIDNYFSMYGYATHRVKKPNRNVRPHWTYCKTNGSKVIGRCPSDDLKKICSIYDNGITWWKNASEVGDYSLDNSPSA